jgi:lipid A 3-O-deacylase
VANPGKWALVSAAIVAAGIIARPAAAQLTVGSPDGPPRLEFGAGAFDLRPSGRPHAATAGDFRAEYHFGDVVWAFSPFIGAEVTTSAATYAYVGLGIDFNLAPNWVVTPNGAGGFFQRGFGSPMGSWFEFRTGLEVAYKFEDQSRFGLAFHHMSNAGLAHTNPGQESLVLTYQIPFR